MTAIAAHRGGALHWPENSVPAFRASAALPIEFVEFDIHAARDGTPVVIHDATLERMTMARGPVGSLTADELAAVSLRAPDAGSVPTLAEVLEIFRGTDVRPRLEIKTTEAGAPYAGLSGAVARTLEAAGMAASSVVTSFSLGSLLEFRAGGGIAPLAWLIEAKQLSRRSGFTTMVRRAREHGMAEMGLPWRRITAPRVTACAQAGLGVSTWTVNAAGALARMFDLGVGVVITDDPMLALSVRERWRRQRAAVTPP